MDKMEYIEAINSELERMKKDNEAVHRLVLTMETVAMQLGWAIAKEERVPDDKLLKR